MSAIPTRRVIQLSSGREVLINAHEFDAAFYEDVEAAEARLAAEAAASTNAGGDSPLSGNVAAAQAHIDTVVDPAELDVLEATENGSEKPRKGVLLAIAGRRETLAAEAAAKAGQES
jgi:hypothetical protein